MIRSCILPSDEFHCISLEFLSNITEEFYKLYETLYGALNCTYNTHIVGSHLIEMRSHGPLTLTSAFSFESFYGEIRRSFVPGTQSTLKQILQKILVKRAISPHCCENTIHFSDYETELESNNLVYLFKQGTHFIYQIVSINGDEFVCRRVGKYPYKFDQTPSINWSKVGVYERGALSSDTEIINKCDIAGKVLKVEN